MIEVLLGDEAVGRAALDAGIGGAFSYPGTPATEIFEFIQSRAAAAGIVADWSANEKVAYEEALGMSFAGRRALVSMKHVGLNVAADPFMSSALTGVHAGLVLAVADDPGMHSSQNEQDTRCYAQFAKLPLLEPSSQQEAYDMTRRAFVLSEALRVPVLIRLVTRLAHSRAAVHTRAPDEPRPLGKAADWRSWTLLPVNARQCYRRLLQLQETLADQSEHAPCNALRLGGPRGFIAAGLAHNYLLEVIGAQATDSVLKIGMYPLPAGLIRRLAQHCPEIHVFEEGYPFIESQLRGVLGPGDRIIHGRMTGAVPPDGELDADQVRRALGLPAPPSCDPLENLPERPPQLCQGCPHSDTYRAILDAVGRDPSQRYCFSDIGCYTLAALPPYSAIDTCVNMGASISMGHGAAKAGAHPVIATIGDSTFIHSGMNALISAVQDDANMTVIILDNAAVAMTGCQAVLATGDQLVELVAALGVDRRHLVKIEPTARNHDENVGLIRREIEHRGLSVIVSCRPCVHVKRQQAAANWPRRSALGSRSS
jgi:indolepyruvate ferredoxin oxidoreductase alpha subunit